ncbi:hypothetical protein BUALT_Bualt01G0069100 [Buddleja alternifolia]|uniref:DUF4005 domain-containing protein n=1 Tax=Buddleja alternifolia TaxID=168488 RepID=A0AAV6Y626_9LAMI|nr:hypothetical protein BUALT_Bualt01G0069100 [Buddleja alternifolia]
MGKATRWFRSLLTFKKSPESSTAAAAEKKKNNRKSKSNSVGDSVKFKNGVEEENPLASPYVDGLDANKHAIAVATATAAVAEAALAAAQAAAEVVKLTSGGGSWRSATPYRGGDRRPVLAAVRIQSAFRAYLARRALRALKALVKLQARVRGYIVRKQSADMLRRMQAMARIQARASAHRSYTTTEASNTDKINFFNSHHPGMTNPRSYEEMSNSAKHGGSLVKMQHNHSRPHMGNNVGKERPHLATNWLNHWMEQCTLNNVRDSSLEAGPGDDERSDKILEVDTWKPHQTPRQNDRRTSASTPQYFSAWKETGHDYSKMGQLSRPSSKLQNPNPSISSEEVSSLISSKFPPEGDQVPAWTAVNSPGGRSSSSRPTSNLRGPFTPTRSECSRSVYGDYLGHPNYMASTESSWAKVRSQSAPKQRMQLEELGLSSKYGRGLWELDANSEKGYSGHLKRQGTPTRDATPGFSSMYRYRL